MLTKRELLQSSGLAAIAAAGMSPGPVLAQMLTGAPAEPNIKYSTQMPPGVAAPAQVETRLGTLRFDSGVPDEATTDKLYDKLDFQRAVQAYLLGLPPVVGGFGAGSKFSWQAIGAVDYEFARTEHVSWSGMIGYKALYVDYSKGSGLSTYDPLWVISRHLRRKKSCSALPPKADIRDSVLEKKPRPPCRQPGLLRAERLKRGKPKEPKPGTVKSCPKF